MGSIEISGRVRFAGQLTIRYSGPGEPLRGFLAINAGDLDFLVEMTAEDAARLSRNAGRMAEHLAREAKNKRKEMT